jgi:hypothetical protein
MTCPVGAVGPYPAGITFYPKTGTVVNGVDAAVFASYVGTSPTGTDTKLPFYSNPLLGIKFLRNGDELAANIGGPPTGQVVTNSQDVSEIYIYI